MKTIPGELSWIISLFISTISAVESISKPKKTTTKDQRGNLSFITKFRLFLTRRSSWSNVNTVHFDGEQILDHVSLSFNVRIGAVVGTNRLLWRMSHFFEPELVFCCCCCKFITSGNDRSGSEWRRLPLRFRGLVRSVTLRRVRVQVPAHCRTTKEPKPKRILKNN